MRFIIYTFELLYAVVDSIIKRVLRGAKRPTWWLTTELFRKTMRKTVDHSLGWGMEWFRNMEDLSSRVLKNDKTVFSEKSTLNNVSVEWFRPLKLNTNKVIIYFHGGGYVYGSSDTHRPFINRIVKGSGTVVLSVNYRLAPENPFPAAHDDALSVYKSILKIGDYKPEQIILMGDSAGAALCTGTLLKLKVAKEEMPSSAVLICPWVDPKAKDNSIISNDEYDIVGLPFLMDCADKYLQGMYEKNPLVAPVYADLSGLPPMLIQVGTAEVLLTQVRALKAKAESDKVKLIYTEYEDMFHTFIISNPNIPQSEAALEEILEYVKGA
jgi:monoterpene epsilon-lactone hydrolase